MLLVDNRPPRSLTLTYFTFFFFFVTSLCIRVYLYILIFIYLYIYIIRKVQCVAGVCSLFIFLFAKVLDPPLCPFLSLVYSHTPFLSRLVLACSLVYHKKVSNASLNVHLNEQARMIDFDER